MTTALDRVSPSYMGVDRFRLNVSELSKPLLDGKVVTIDVDYAGAEPGGVQLPLILRVQPEFGTGRGYRRKAFRRSAPKSITFRPRGAGSYLVLLQEQSHNQWQGRLTVQVGGEQFDDVEDERD
jgi:hypothetical protein